MTYSAVNRIDDQLIGQTKLQLMSAMELQIDDVRLQSRSLSTWSTSIRVLYFFVPLKMLCKQDLQNLRPRIYAFAGSFLFVRDIQSNAWRGERRAAACGGSESIEWRGRA